VLQLAATCSAHQLRVDLRLLDFLDVDVNLLLGYVLKLVLS